MDISQINKSSFAEASRKAVTTENLSRAKSTDMTTGGYRLDISGTVMDNAASRLYTNKGMEDSQGKTIEDCMQGIYGQDVSVQHNYMAIMSNFLSAEDYSKLKEDGFRLGDMPMDEAVTVVDQIKITLAEAGINIEGYTDTLDSDTIKAAVGNASRAAQIENSLKENDLPVTASNTAQAEKALEMASLLNSECEANGISDAAIRYLLSNGSELTLENVYLAQFQGSSYGNWSQGINNVAYDQMASQINRVIEEADLQVNEDTINAAKWIIGNQQQLNAENLTTYTDLKNVEFPIDEKQLLDNVADALAEGKKGTQALLIKKDIVLTQAQLELTSEANKSFLLTGEFIDNSVMKEKLDELTRQLSEIEAQNTNTSGNMVADISAIDIKAEPVAFYNAVSAELSGIKELPVDTIADFINEAEYTLNDVYDKGKAYAARYQNAADSYEALRTEIRTDLGDSIKKAFRNVDDILKEEQLVVNDSNRRAVRILGYNQMEINADNISAAKEAYDKVAHAIDLLKPAAVVKLIRDGVNPLSMSVEELTDRLMEFNSSDENDEKYSEYLLKLEQNNKITEEEKESYIGIYRLFRQVEKSDGAVIGSLLNSKTDITVKNLLSAVRSRKSKGMDYTVDDGFGGLEKKLSENSVKIDTQINSAFQSQDYYERATRDVLDTLDPDKVLRMWDEGSLNNYTELEEFRDNLARPLETMGNNYFDELEAENLRQAAESSKEAAMALTEYDITVTLDSLMAMDSLIYNMGDAFRQLARYKKEIDTEKLIENFETEDGAKAAIEDLVKNSTEQIEESMDDADISSRKVQDLRLLGKQIRLIGTLSKQENYHVPIEIEGELTAVNLKVVHGTNEESVEAVLHSKEYGSISMKLFMDGDEADGYMLSNNEYGADFLREKKEQLKESLESVGIRLKESFDVIKNRELDIKSKAARNPAKSDKSSEKQVSGSKLYKLAKCFLKVMSA